MFYCTKCGELKLADEDECIKCHNTEFELKPVERRKIMTRIMSEITNETTGESVTLPKETEITVTPYVPNSFPIVIRKNISTNTLFGISDAKMIETSQKLNNSLLNKISERILKAGSIIALPKTLRNKLKVDNSELKLLYYDTPNEAQGIIVKTLQPQLGNETYLMDSAYATARQTLGITNTFQGREDNSAISSKAKAMQIQQTAGRLESKREMKKASLIALYELMFQFILAYSYEYRGYYVTIEGREEFKVYDNRLFLVNKDENYFYDDEYTFDIDMSASLENDRQTMWEETRMNFSSGAYGDPQSLETLKMFWQTMYKLSYPGAKEYDENIKNEIWNSKNTDETQKVVESYKECVFNIKWRNDSTNTPIKWDVFGTVNANNLLEYASGGITGQELLCLSKESSDFWTISIPEGLWPNKSLYMNGLYIMQVKESEVDDPYVSVIGPFANSASPILANQEDATTDGMSELKNRVENS